ncbi:hypothetical protein RhiJN_15471 [Ceratobasidium sp. AG-Ba]|nr:hypothetical protein RhiJN_15471 [Ceratobasidium sp. AG-Ba]
MSTPVLTYSSSSLSESPLVSPSSARFTCAPDLPLSNRPLSCDEARVYFEDHSEAWWTPRASIDSTDFAATESRPHGLPKRQLSDDILGAAQPAHDLHFGKYVNTASERLSALALDQGSHRISSPLIQDVDLESPSSTPDSAVVPTEPGRAGEASRPFELILSDSISYLAQNSILNVNVIPPSPEEMYRSNTRCSSFPGFNRPAPYRDPAVELSNSCSNLNNSSWPQSSMLAHCEQHSLFPPSEAMTQTYPGRLTLREAGIPYSSPKALAPPMPVENIPSNNNNIRQRTSMFFQRLVHKTFSRSQPTKPKGPSPPQFPPQFPPHDGPATEPRVPGRSRTSRCSISLPFTRTESSLTKKDIPDPPKRSRWRMVHRFIAKPGTVAKATVPDASLNQSLAVLRRHSSVSFLGDAMTRVDPFARPGGLGARMSTPASPDGHPGPHGTRRASMPASASAHTLNRRSHIISLPSQDDPRVSQDRSEESVTEFQTPTTDRMNFHDSTVDVVDPDLSETIDSRDLIELPAGLKNVGDRRCMNRVERRHSAPSLNGYVQLQPCSRASTGPF